MCSTCAILSAPPPFQTLEEQILDSFVLLVTAVQRETRILYQTCALVESVPQASCKPYRKAKAILILRCHNNLFGRSTDNKIDLWPPTTTGFWVYYTVPLCYLDYVFVFRWVILSTFVSCIHFIDPVLSLYSRCIECMCVCVHIQCTKCIYMYSIYSTFVA